MELLSRSEELVLLAIWKLQDNAYGITIRDTVNESAGKNWSIGAIYAPLHRLEKKGFVESSKGDPVPERGGRAKIFYTVLPEGIKAMTEILQIHKSIWSDIPSIETDRVL
jgi:DNA-binding PadR family transcriptional regulator